MPSIVTARTQKPVQAIGRQPRPIQAVQRGRHERASDPRPALSPAGQARVMTNPRWLPAEILRDQRFQQRLVLHRLRRVAPSAPVRAPANRADALFRVRKLLIL
jgi:hypothetical protein